MINQNKRQSDNCRYNKFPCSLGDGITKKQNITKERYALEKTYSLLTNKYKKYYEQTWAQVRSLM